MSAWEYGSSGDGVKERSSPGWMGEKVHVRKETGDGELEAGDWGYVDGMVDAGPPFGADG